jgi:hypothetical protein
MKPNRMMLSLQLRFPNPITESDITGITANHMHEVQENCWVQLVKYVFLQEAFNCFIFIDYEIKVLVFKKTGQIYRHNETEHFII